MLPVQMPQTIYNMLSRNTHFQSNFDFQNADFGMFLRTALAPGNFAFNGAQS